MVEQSWDNSSLWENDPIAIVEGYESSQLTPIERDFLFYRQVTLVWLKLTYNKAFRKCGIILHEFCPDP
ncbi:hypothetical protein [Dapis sp. BLCC M229]|uniref:hypothetical protein n=1 Tax=Dapis sp. BLCC M229 TaxID=3400188 RepID=UPI003CEE4520